MNKNLVGISIGSTVGGKHNTINNLMPLRNDEISLLLSEIRSAIGNSDITEEQRNDAEHYIATIEDAIDQDSPHKSTLNSALEGLKKIAANGGISNLIEKLSPIIVAMITNKP